MSAYEMDRSEWYDSWSWARLELHGWATRDRPAKFEWPALTTDLGAIHLLQRRDRPGTEYDFVKLRLAGPGVGRVVRVHRWRGPRGRLP